MTLKNHHPRARLLTAAARVKAPAQLVNRDRPAGRAAGVDEASRRVARRPAALRRWKQWLGMPGVARRRRDHVTEAAGVDGGAPLRAGDDRGEGSVGAAPADVFDLV